MGLEIRWSKWPESRACQPGVSTSAGSRLAQLAVDTWISPLISWNELLSLSTSVVSNWLSRQCRNSVFLSVALPRHCRQGQWMCLYFLSLQLQVAIFFSRPAFHLAQSAILCQAAWLLSVLSILLAAMSSLSNQRSLYIFWNTRDKTRTNETHTLPKKSGNQQEAPNTLLSVAVTVGRFR